MLVATAALVAYLAACGDDPVPIDEIPPDSRLSQLDSAEMDGVCAWGKGIANQKLPPGTNCHGTPIMFSGCMKVPAACTATVAQWRICMPNLLDRFAQDPCQVLDFAFSPGDFTEFIEATPGCQGLGPCGTTMR
jgi:hypothetical protein